ncbi:MAG: M15 family metallopeptidase [Gemella sp.]|nr:M15 family metallopeptidase [Gemella sp.]
MKKLLTLLFTVSIAALAFFVYTKVIQGDRAFDSKPVATTQSAQENGQGQNSAENTQNSEPAAADPNAKPETVTQPTMVNGIMIVNKKHPLPATFAPGEDPTASAAIRQLIVDAQAQGLDVSNNLSGFRSYENQTGLYNNYVAQSGQAEADTFSARPGYSEHQSGLAFDLIDNAGALLGSEGSSATSQQAAAWVAENAHNYGFIVRYKPGFEEVTGYQAEAWHLRYVGKEIATEIHAKNIPLEQYLNVQGGTYNN